MNKARLLACPACQRHVRSSEAVCPFCAASIPISFKDAPPPRAPTRRLSRAALYAFGATSLTLATACSGSVTDVEDNDASADVAPDQGVGPTPSYGAPGMPIEAGPPEPDGGVGPVYGAPADAEPPLDGPQGPDSGLEGGVGPVYGSPPHDAAIPPKEASIPPFDASLFDGGGIASYGLPPVH